MGMYDHIRKTKGDAGSEEFDPYKLLKRGEDYGQKPVRHNVVDVGNKDTLFEDSNWKTGPVGRGGGAPEHDSYDTKQADAYSPAGKYGKKGGSGQRSGA